MLREGGFSGYPSDRQFTHRRIHRKSLLILPIEPVDSFNLFLTVKMRIAQHHLDRLMA